MKSSAKNGTEVSPRQFAPQYNVNSWQVIIGLSDVCLSYSNKSHDFKNLIFITSSL